MNTGAPVRARGPLVLADISGYTSFLQAVAAAHIEDADTKVPDAYAMMSTLLDGIVDRMVPPFTLSKLEGDAVFAFATEDDVLPTGDAMLACLADCYAEFRRRNDAGLALSTCSCSACSMGNGLDLKFIVHAGSFVVQSIAVGRELAGPDVVMAHRLLKTRAAEVAGSGGYALVTAPAAERFGVETGDALPLVETYDHYAPIDCWVFRLGVA
jgi:hypothetical protein